MHGTLSLALNLTSNPISTNISPKQQHIYGARYIINYLLTPEFMSNVAAVNKTVAS